MSTYLFFVFAYVFLDLDGHLLQFRQMLVGKEAASYMIDFFKRFDSFLEVLFGVTKRLKYSRLRHVLHMVQPMLLDGGLLEVNKAYSPKATVALKVTHGHL